MIRAVSPIVPSTLLTESDIPAPIAAHRPIPDQGALRRPPLDPLPNVGEAGRAATHTQNVLGRLHLIA